MARLAWASIVERHVHQLPQLEAWAAAKVKVAEGPIKTSAAVPNWLTLGYVAGEDAGATWEQTPDDEIDGITREDGTIAAELACTSGGNDVSLQRVRLAGLLDAWQQWLLEDNTQGGALLGHSRLQLSADISLSLGNSGASAKALVAVSYVARVDPAR